MSVFGSKQKQTFREWPIFGSIPALRRDCLGYFQKLANESPRVAPFRVGPFQLYLLSDPAIVAKVFETQGSHFSKGHFTRLLEPLIGNGLVTSDGDHWRKQRKIAQPTFHPKNIMSLVEPMVQEINDACQELKRLKEGSTIDMYEVMMELTLNIISKILLGQDTSKDLAQVRHSMAVITPIVNNRFWSPAKLLNYIPTRDNINFNFEINRLKKLIDRMILNSQQTAEGEGNNLLEKFVLAARDQPSAGSLQSLRDEVITFYIAGYETTTNFLTWFWYLMDQNQSVYRAIQEEVATVCGSESPTIQNLFELKLLRRSLQETLRLYPPVWTIARECEKPIKIEGLDFKKGDTAVLSPWVMHRNHKYWDNPTEFEPDRFLPDRFNQMPQGLYFPFGKGTRTCIGNNLAMAEATLITAIFIQNFDIRAASNEPVEPVAAITLKPRNGFRVQLKNRNKDDLDSEFGAQQTAS